MRNFHLKIFSGVLFFIISSASYSQLKVSDELKQRLQGKTKFYDIQSEVEGYYKQEITRAGSDALKQKTIERQRKFWNRWLYWAESHLDENGEVAENSAALAYQATGNTNITPNARTAYGDWSFVGPSYAPDGVGRVNRLAFHPTNSNIIYAGTSAGGLWRLTWSGTSYSWSCLTNYIPELSISGIVISHANANVIYILTGDGDAGNGGFVNTWGYRGSSIGVLISTDAGITWSQTAAFPGVSGTVLGFKLNQDPNNAAVLIAATNKGLFRTANAGLSWQSASFKNYDNLTLPNDNTAFDVEFKPGSSSIVYAAYLRTAGTSSASFFKSYDGGVSFKEITAFGSVNRMGIAVTPANSNYVYLLCGPGYIVDGDATLNTFRGFYYSNDSGESLNQQTNQPDILGNITPTLILGHQSNYDLAVSASPVNASIVMTGGLIVCKTENKGLTFTEMTDYFPSDPDDDDCIHPDVHDLAYNPLDGRLYGATDGGISVSSDNGNNFTLLFNGLQIGQFYHFEPSNENGKIWGGAQDCGVLEQVSGSQFSLYRGGDGYDVLTDKIGNNDDSYVVVNTNIYDDSPAGFDNITPPGQTEFFPLIAMHATNEDILFAGYTNSLYRSLERGDNWAQITGTTARWALTSCPSNGGRLYCAGNQSNSLRGLQRIDGITSGPTVTSLNSGIYGAGYPSSFPKITCIAVNPSSSAQVWITVGGFTDSVKVLYSSNAGVDWVNRSGSLPNVPATSIITDAAGNTYVGTDIGVYYRSSSMNDWTPFYNDLPRVAISGLAFLDVYNPLDPPNPIKYLYASTFGRGIWRSEIFANCTAALTISQTLRGQQSFQAGTSISSTSLVNAGLGTEVYFQSGNYVNLTPGFEAFSGTLFKSTIRPCNSGPLYPGVVTMLDDKTNKIINSTAETFGKIVQIELDKTNVNIQLNIHEPGKYSLWITDEKGDVNKKIWDDGDMEKGLQHTTISLSDLPKGFYYISLLHNSSSVHFQELNW